MTDLFSVFPYIRQQSYHMTVHTELSTAPLNEQNRCNGADEPHEKILQVMLASRTSKNDPNCNTAIKYHHHHHHQGTLLLACCSRMYSRHVISMYLFAFRDLYICRL